MKKMVSILLALTLMMTGIASLAEVAVESVTGDWYGNVFGALFTMTLNEDGTYLMLTPDGEQAGDGTWELKDGAIYMDGGESASDMFQIVEGTLFNEGMNVTFYRNQEEVQVIELAEVNPDALAEDFNGNWTCKYMRAMGMLVGIGSAIASGQMVEVPSLTFQDGKLTLQGSDLNSLVGEEGLEMTFADGAYNFSLDIGDMSISFDLKLLQDGLLGFVINMGETDVGLYFEKAE